MNTLRSQLLRIVIVSLLPVIAVALWQVWASLQDSRELVTTRLRANAAIIADQQSDPFVIAEHALLFAATQAETVDMGPRCSAVLAGVLSDAPRLSNFLRTDASGKARCSALPFTPGEDLSQAKWWLERAGRRSLYFASPQYGTISRRHLYIMVLPLFGRDGTFQGTISAGLRIDELTAALRRSDAVVPGAVMIADDSGRIVFGSDKVRFPGLPGVEDARFKPGQAKASDGTKWVYVSTPLFRDKLHVVYAEPDNTIIRDASARIAPSLVLPLIALALSSVAIWIASKRLILDWLERLRALTAQFASGDYRSDQQQFADAPQELSSFAADLHDMAHAIRAHQYELEDALEIRKALTREVNHRVKNNLQIITSLLTLQAERVTDREAAAVLGQARTRIGALGLIHRLLYEEQADYERGQVALERLVSDLCAQLRSNYRVRKEISLDCTSVAMKVSADAAVPLTLFIVEAVNNAYAHAFAPGQSGRVLVSIARDGARGVLQIADDGTGFDVATASDTIGLDLIRAFAEQVGGVLAIESGPAGTTLSLTLDAPERAKSPD